MRNPKRIYDFKDYALSYTLNACAGHVSVKSLCTQGVLELFEFDRQKDKEYVRILKVYLDQEMNITRTAEILHLHRTSLIKRVEKIEQLLQLSLKDSRTRLYLRLLLSFHEEGYLL